MADQSQDKDAVVAGPATNGHASATPAIVTAVVNPIEGQPEEDVVVPVAYLEENDLVAAVVNHLQQPDEITPLLSGVDSGRARKVLQMFDTQYLFGITYRFG